MRKLIVILLFAFAAEARYAGKPLADALRDLQSQGLRIIYSDDVVTPSMIVRAEPRATEPRRILHELLGEHGLTTKPGPRGSLLVVRAAPSPRPEKKNAETPPPPMPIAIEEIIVTPSRFTILRDEPESRQFLSREEVQRVPHLSDDLYRAIGRIPGVTGTDVSARFNLRGGAEDEVLVLVDGAEIYDPFHVRDLSRAFSVIDAEAVGAVDVLSGGYPAEYGGRMSGVVDISTLSPSETRHEVGISLLNMRAKSQGTFAESRGSWMVSFRRGYLRELLSIIDNTDDLNPRYYDLLGKAQWVLGERAVVSAHVLASRDRLDLIEDPGTDASAAYDDRYLWLNLRGSVTPKVFAQSVLSFGEIARHRGGQFDNTVDSQSGGLEDRHESRFVSLKNDGRWELSPRNLLKFGATAKRVRASYDFEAASTVQFALFALGAPPREIVRSIHLRPDGSEFSAYIADRVRITDTVTIEAGIRAASESYTPDGINAGPRINLAWTPSARTSFRAAWGVFHQPQPIHELPVEDGVTEFSPSQRAEHVVAGLEHLFGNGVVARLEAYDKTFTQVRPRFENLFDRLLIFPELRADRVRIAPERGHARGAEVLVRTRSDARLSGWLSYTLARVTDTIDGREVPRAWDQRHAATFSVNYRRGDRWNFNVAGTWHTGWPTTPVVAQLLNGNVVSELGPRSSTRLRDYRRVDVRVSRSIGNFDFFIELFNVLSFANVTRVEAFQFFIDGNEVRAMPVTEAILPIVPSFGVTWRF